MVDSKGKGRAAGPTAVLEARAVDVLAGQAVATVVAVATPLVVGAAEEAKVAEAAKAVEAAVAAELQSAGPEVSSRSLA